MPDLKAHSKAILHRIRGLFDIRYFFSPSTIIPVMVINDQFYAPASAKSVTINTAIDTATIMTSRDDKNTYINSAIITIEAQSISTVANVTINVIQNGATVAIARVNLGTTTTREHIVMVFPKPIIVDRNTAVTLDLGGDASTSEQITGLVSFSEEDAQEAHF